MDKVTRNRARGRGVVRAALASVVAVMLIAPVVPVSASEPPEGTFEAKPAVREEAPWSPGNYGMAVWFWPEGNRAYQLDGSTSNVLKAYDTSTHPPTFLDDQELDPPAWGSTTEFTSSSGRHHIATVDRENGRVFVAYATNAQDAPNPGEARAAFLESPCPGAGQAVCVGGVHVLDGGSLELLGRIPLQLPSAESPDVIPAPKSLEYVPAVPELGWGGRVLMLVEELAPNIVENSTVPATNSSSQYATPRRSGANIAYAVSLDPETMRQEWAVRVEGCRNSREQRGWLFAAEGHPATMFRTAGDDPALYVGCHGNASQQGVVVRVPLDADGVPAGLPVRVGDPVKSLDPDAEDLGLGQVAAAAPRQEVFAGPDKVTVMLADPVSQRMLMRVDDSGEVWWVFDARANQFLGTIGIGSYQHGHTTYGLDPDTGRLYVVAAPPMAEDAANGPGGLYIADIRRNPLAQALHYPELADVPRSDTAGSLASTEYEVGRAMSVMPRGGGDEARIYVTKTRVTGSAFRVLVDGSPVSVDSPPDGGGIVRTLDIPESEGVTAATFDGTARGFGFRTILLAGVEGAARVGPADPVGMARGLPDATLPRHTDTKMVTQALPRPDGCSDAQRELIVAFVGPRGPAVVDASSARGEAQPVLVDVRTKDDVAAPVTRCLPVDWQSLWESALVSRAPMEEPGVAWPFEDATSSCTATEEEQSDSWSDPVVGVFSSKVTCSQDEAGGWGQARGIGIDGVSVADTLASFRIYLDAERGMVARVESIARGVNIGGIVKIDTIRGSAESWANGRLPVQDELTEDEAAAEDEEFNPFNCDVSRPAGTCFQRHIFGVTVVNPSTGGVGYKCGPCGDEDALIEGLNRGFGAYASARFRQPDPVLARGSDDGYIAAITKKSQERFADIVMNADLLDTMVPMLEVIRYAPHGRPSHTKGQQTDYSFGTPPRGRQIYQFAAVEVSSTYSVQCLLVYDEATNTCAEAAEVPGSIQVSLSDPDGEPLAGGAFEVREDVDADGVLGLVDTLLPDGACVTAEDGIGTCVFENLAPGSYLVSQVAAPPGYAKTAEPWVSEVASGEQRTVAFTNVSNVSTIDMTVTDEAGAPLSGATFAAYPDPDADGKVAPDAEPAATCTTDGQGVCSMQVPAGSYVLVQTGAPGGLEGIEPVAFTFSSGGQVAAVTVVNYPPSQPAAPEAAASPPVVDYSPPVDYRPPVESIDDTYVPADMVDAPTTVAPSVPEQIGGTVVQVIRAPGDALRLFARDPQQAVAFTAALALLALALLAVLRRQLLGGLTAMPAFAFTGGDTPPLPPAPPRSSGPSAGPGPSGGSSGGPGGSRGSSGNDGPGRPAGDAPVAFSDKPPASSPSMHTATAVLERPPFVAGAAPSALERASARIVVATSHPVLAALATQRLVDAPSCDVVAVADSLEELRRSVADHAPDVVVIDLAMPTGSDEDVCDALATLHPAERTVGLIPPNRAIEALVTRGHAAGLGGLLAADEDLTNGQLGYAVRCVSVGKTFFGPAVQATLLRKFPAPARPKSPPALLTPRQLEVARLAAGGLKRSDIAKRLFLSPATVKLHLSLARKRLGVTDPWDTTQLRKRLDEAGLLDAPDRQAD